METYDLVVIGAGPGGYPAAIRGAQLGASVAIIEQEHLGGTCLNWGCIPSKALIAAGDLYGRVKHAAEFGVVAPGATVDYAAMIRHKDKVVQQMRGGVKQLLAGNGVKLFTGTAGFKDRNTLEISGTGAPTAIGAKHTIIATGSTSAMPGFLPQHPRVVESRGFLELTSLPARLLVLGGGFIGCEFACLAAQCGSQVTVVELLEDILLLLDSDVRREVRRHLEEQLGIKVLTGQALEEIQADDRSVRGRCGDQVLEADCLISAVGRLPVTAGLNLENAGIKTTDRGFIEADDYGRTSVGTVYAIGDVTGKTQLAHYATAQGITAAENACTNTPHKHETLVPNVIFTVPEVGTVGLSEDAAKQAGRAVTTGKFRFSGLGRALAVGETAGFVKWIADAQTDQLLGAAAVGPHATELIAQATIAIRAEFTTRELGKVIHAHPTFSESWMEAAHNLHGEAIHAPPRRKK
ncbi:dihydrolipoyl dehydrogenase [bacterium]|nr:dihydrolipoyl dehydrogenase [bacterium]